MKLEKFPFGKYKGKTIDEIPCTYLAYAIENFDLPDDYINKMRIELFNRLKIDDLYFDIQYEACERAINKYRDPVEKGGGFMSLKYNCETMPKNTLSVVIEEAFSNYNKMTGLIFDEE